jgi:hypothetical protein
MEHFKQSKEEEILWMAFIKKWPPRGITLLQQQVASLNA